MTPTVFVLHEIPEKLHDAFVHFASNGDALVPLNAEEVLALGDGISQCQDDPNERGLFSVDLPRLEESWEDIATFSRRGDAVAFCQEHFGADDRGRVGLITMLEVEGEECPVCHSTNTIEPEDSDNEWLCEDYGCVFTSDENGNAPVDQAADLA